MVLVSSGLLSLKSAAGADNRNISLEVDGNNTGNKSLTDLCTTSGIENADSITDFYAYEKTNTPTDLMLRMYTRQGTSTNNDKSYNYDIFLTHKNENGDEVLSTQRNLNLSVTDLTTIKYDIILQGSVQFDWVYDEQEGNAFIPSGNIGSFIDHYFQGDTDINLYLYNTYTVASPSNNTGFESDGQSDSTIYYIGEILSYDNGTDILFNDITSSTPLGDSVYGEFGVTNYPVSKILSNTYLAFYLECTGVNDNNWELTGGNTISYTSSL